MARKKTSARPRRGSAATQGFDSATGSKGRGGKVGGRGADKGAGNGERSEGTEVRMETRKSGRKTERPTSGLGRAGARLTRSTSKRSVEDDDECAEVCREVEGNDDIFEEKGDLVSGRKEDEVDEDVAPASPKVKKRRRTTTGMKVGAPGKSENSRNLAGGRNIHKRDKTPERCASPSSSEESGRNSAGSGVDEPGEDSPEKADEESSGILDEFSPEKLGDKSPEKSAANSSRKFGESGRKDPSKAVAVVWSEGDCEVQEVEDEVLDIDGGMLVTAEGNDSDGLIVESGDGAGLDVESGDGPGREEDMELNVETGNGANDDDEVECVAESVENPDPITHSALQSRRRSKSQTKSHAAEESAGRKATGHGTREATLREKLREKSGAAASTRKRTRVPKKGIETVAVTTAEKVKSGDGANDDNEVQEVPKKRRKAPIGEGCDEDDDDDYRVGPGGNEGRKGRAGKKKIMDNFDKPAPTSTVAVKGNVPNLTVKGFLESSEKRRVSAGVRLARASSGGGSGFSKTLPAKPLSPGDDVITIDSEPQPSAERSKKRKSDSGKGDSEISKRKSKRLFGKKSNPRSMSDFNFDFVESGTDDVYQDATAEARKAELGREQALAQLEDEKKRDEIQKERDLALGVATALPSRVMFLYPPGTKRGRVEIKSEDADRLKPLRYLNDSLVDFYIKYLQENVLLFEFKKNEDVFCFSSFFFGRLRPQPNDERKSIDYQGVRRWTKSVDIFEKKMVFVPICDSYHWSLIIIVNLHNLSACMDEGSGNWSGMKVNRPTIIYVDSLSGGPRGDQFAEMAKSYLVEEWLSRKEQGGDDTVEVDSNRQSDVRTIIRKVVRILKPRVPFQTNEYDCGLYVLWNVIRLFRDDGFKERCLDKNGTSEQNMDPLQKQYCHDTVVDLREVVKLAVERLTPVAVLDQIEKDVEERDVRVKTFWDRVQDENDAQAQSFAEVESEVEAEEARSLGLALEDSLLGGEEEANMGKGASGDDLAAVGERKRSRGVSGKPESSADGIVAKAVKATPVPSDDEEVLDLESVEHNDTAVPPGSDEDKISPVLSARDEAAVIPRNESRRTSRDAAADAKQYPNDSSPDIMEEDTRFHNLDGDAPIAGRSCGSRANPSQSRLTGHEQISLHDSPGSLRPARHRKPAGSGTMPMELPAVSKFPKTRVDVDGFTMGNESVGGEDAAEESGSDDEKLSGTGSMDADLPDADAPIDLESEDSGIKDDAEMRD